VRSARRALAVRKLSRCRPPRSLSLPYAPPILVWADAAEGVACRPRSRGNCGKVLGRIRAEARRESGGGSEGGKRKAEAEAQSGSGKRKAEAQSGSAKRKRKAEAQSGSAKRKRRARFFSSIGHGVRELAWSVRRCNVVVTGARSRSRGSGRFFLTSLRASHGSWSLFALRCARGALTFARVRALTVGTASDVNEHSRCRQRVAQGREILGCRLGECLRRLSIPSA
jgi:hypothetical protein